MKIETRQTCANSTPARFKEAYGRDGGERILIFTGEPASKTIMKLFFLGEEPSPDKIDEIIGNTSWTKTSSCDACNNDDNGPRVMVGQEPDYDSRTAWLCFDCVEAAHSLALEHRK